MIKRYLNLVLKLLKPFDEQIQIMDGINLKINIEHQNLLFKSWNTNKKFNIEHQNLLLKSWNTNKEFLKSKWAVQLRKTRHKIYYLLRKLLSLVGRARPHTLKSNDNIISPE